MRQEQNQMMSKVDVLLNSQQERMNQLENKANLFEELANKVVDLKENFEALNVNIKKLEISSKTQAEELVTETRSVGKKVYDFQPSLLTIVRAQNEIQKIQREIHAFATKNDAKVAQKEEENRQRNIQELANREEISNRLEGLKADFERQAVTLESLTKSSKVQEVLDKTNLLETDLREKIQNVGKKVDELHPSVALIKNVQNGVQKMQMDMNTILNLNLVQKEIQELLNSLVETYSWMKQKIFVINGRMQNSDGKAFSLEECKNAIENQTPWTLFPEEYEVECRNSICRKQFPVSLNLREDKACVECPICHSGTMLGAPKAGYEWCAFSPCGHCHQVPIGEEPENCLFCGKEASCRGPWNNAARVPRRK